ncbi:16S rRNA (cytosine(1402)-N(4))-methyltransferase RsmH [Francisella philomiragia]|uniref:16S rRNA (cytosine(1402)-N(4))-methyltransferase RsmH n=1 Tax=Francisella philomiragia TaxID=28110 RepID=UPI001906C60D|nr:16S rRNA (cytosine(1402)-N(4))-methyltransferase RsmH [Francisella philomiragia]MBK2267961.1 16S rRNA (cytosine(1402)-N(4))-methyltransferase RsmH [Francisella philomiragia]MBK2279329.1 16S rRNA (cytosine(1402)-N(4))-methyltransferase RsmH [Francisella philomiragia]MBK2287183.1 16S rRNA (cytosine(1402)-N(4))-methyltransferase RsmH [Francisella philomiragia]MBK2289161.1 16S rRNA (cytosine(1402)-N(4))-methyltransferase RsmH [Francisella philomiragia]MBK2290879.1 16S rRNA (cytosine(1402)-N(4))
MHFSVLLQESIADLNINPEGIYIDATFGRGGHSKAILDKLTSGRLIAFDKDLDAIDYATHNFHNDNFEIVHASFTYIYDYCLQHNLLGKVDGIIMDLGVSSPQLDNANRGFSFTHDGPLDMRMDISKGLTASQALEELSVDELTYIFKVYGEERFAKKIALRIKDYIAENGSITTTHQLAELIRATIGKREKKNPATRCFQALRIYVNDELKDLEILLESILDVIRKGGRVAAISFHSLEDRIVKQKFTSLINPKQETNRIAKMLPQDNSQVKMKWITKKAKANQDELSQNVRSRSAILRVVEKL